MNAELSPLTPTTDQRAKMAYVYIRQSSLMQLTRHGESPFLQYSLVQRAVALGWPRDRVELIGELRQAVKAKRRVYKSSISSASAKLWSGWTANMAMARSLPI